MAKKKITLEELLVKEETMWEKSPYKKEIKVVFPHYKTVPRLAKLAFHIINWYGGSIRIVFTEKSEKRP